MSATLESANDSIRDVFGAKHPTSTDVLWSILTGLMCDAQAVDIDKRLEKLSVVELQALEKAAVALRRSMLWGMDILLQTLGDHKVKLTVAESSGARSMSGLLQRFVETVVAEDFVAATASWSVDDIIYFDSTLAGPPNLHHAAFQVVASGKATVAGYTVQQFMSRARDMRIARNIRQAS